MPNRKPSQPPVGTPPLPGGDPLADIRRLRGPEKKPRSLVRFRMAATIFFAVGAILMVGLVTRFLGWFTSGSP